MPPEGPNTVTGWGLGAGSDGRALVKGMKMALFHICAIDSSGAIRMVSSQLKNLRQDNMCLQKCWSTCEKGEQA